MHWGQNSSLRLIKRRGKLSKPKQQSQNGFAECVWGLLPERRDAHTCTTAQELCKLVLGLPPFGDAPARSINGCLRRSKEGSASQPPVFPAPGDPTTHSCRSADGTVHHLSMACVEAYCHDHGKRQEQQLLYLGDKAAATGAPEVLTAPGQLCCGQDSVTLGNVWGGPDTWLVRHAHGSAWGPNRPPPATLYTSEEL